MGAYDAEVALACVAKVRPIVADEAPYESIAENTPPDARFGGVGSAGTGGLGTGGLGSGVGGRWVTAITNVVERCS